MNLLRIIRFKTFTKEELVKLGFAAFVHDIYFKKAFPGLTPNRKLGTLSDQSNIEKHASESYHIMKGFEMDYHVNKAVLQHHERVDGSGFPDGVTERMFSKYTSIISFAERYVSLTQANPFNPVYHPTAALKHIMTKEKEGFDTDVIISFAKASTMVPIGSWVQLENSLIGYASTRIDGSNLPMIRAVMQENGESLPTPREFHAALPGNRVSKLLMKEQLAAINRDYKTFYTK